MKIRTLRTLVAAATISLAAFPAWAADREPVTLADGTTGMAEILATTPDSISVKFTRKGMEIQTLLPVKRLDPISYYEIRRQYMESTPENHVRLAVHCAENGMLNQARFQMDMARALDPDIEQKLKDRPEVMEKIATRLAEGARRMYDKGDYKGAFDLVQILATRFTETAAAAKADEALDLLEQKIKDREAAEIAARQKKITDAQDAAVRAEAEKREAVIAKLEQQQSVARKRESDALRQRNSNNALTMHEQAAEHYRKFLPEFVAAGNAAAGDKELTDALRDLEQEVRTEYADVLINIGNLHFPRSNWDKAEEAGKAALAACPGYARATAFLESVDVAREQAEEFRNLKITRGKR